MKSSLKVFIIVKMEQTKKFYDIIVKPEYKEYNDVWIMVKRQPYLVRLPVIDKTYLRELAIGKIHYRLENPSPKKRGAKRKYQYKDKYEANRLYQKAFKAKNLVKACA